MGFHDVQFPSKIAYGAIGGAEFNTTITSTLGGFEQRNINWDKARGRWDVSTGLKTKEDMDILQAFFKARFGKAFGFRFKDWSDFIASNQTLGTANGTQTIFQLVKIYTSGGYLYTRIITKPVVSTLKLYVNATLQTSGFTVNGTTGKITFSSPPSSGSIITATFEFDVPVRFDTDSLSSRIDRGNIYVWDSIPLIEIRS